MPQIRKGHSIVVDDLCFEYQGKVVHVYGRERRNHVGSFSALDGNLPSINTVQDFEIAIMWWLHENDMRF